MRALVLALALLAGLHGAAAAHPMDIGTLRIAPRAQDIEVSLDVDIAATIARPIAIDIDGCTGGAEATTEVGRTRRLARTFHCDAMLTHTVTLNFLRSMPARFQLLAQQGDDSLRLVDRAQPALVVEGGHTSHVGFIGFILSGVAHIGAAPSEWRTAEGSWHLPDGIDHILFLLGLLLGGGTLLQMLGVATGFTVGHTITLALATLGIVHPPARIIEPLIALSIAFVAIEALTSRWRRYRWQIALGFGLVHGFGFANALAPLQLSRIAKLEALLGYNLGVELGQLIIVMALAPLVLAAYRRPWARRWAITPAALLIFVAGMYWFFQRL